MITDVYGLYGCNDSNIPKLKICPSTKTWADEHEDHGVFGMSLVRFQYHEARPMRSTFSLERRIVNNMMKKHQKTSWTIRLCNDVIVET